jgi:NNP family nitrate/nitrite transporter-like MFS transporter
MGFDVTALWKAPRVNPITQKARSIPVLNPINLYGRVFFFSWMGFMLAFWAWWVCPTTKTISCHSLTSLAGTRSLLFLQ